MQKLLKKVFTPKYYWLIPLVISLGIVSLWHKPGFIIAGGEEGLAFAYPERTSEFYSHSWTDSDMGRPQTTSHSRYPVFAALSFLNSLGLSASFLQILLFGILLIVGVLGMYFFVYKMFDNYEIALISSVFYMLNSYTFANIWHRFVSPLMFSYALLPLSALFYYLFIKNKRLVNLLLFIIVNLVFSYSFSSPAFVITMWGALLIITVAETISIEESFKRKLKPFALFLITLFTWLATNWWWMRLQLVNTASFYTSVFTSEYNLQVARSISAQYPFNTYIRLGYPAVLPDYINLVNLLIPLVVVFGLLRLKNKMVKWLSLIFLLVSLLVLNGTNPPTGFLFEFFFNKSVVFQLFRNPYEKFGIILMFVYSFLFAVGLRYLIKKFKPVSFIIIFSLSVAYLGLWSSPTFGSETSEAYTKVPKEYERVNSLMEPDEEYFRALSIPFIPGDGARLDWKHPYQGVQPNRQLFDISTLSKITRIKEFDNYWKVLRASLYQGKLHELIRFGSIKYLLVHKDLDTKFLGINAVSEEFSYTNEAYRSDASSESVICSDYVLNTACELAKEGVNWGEIKFIRLYFEKGNKGSLKVDFQDNSAKHLVFNGQIESLYEIKPDMDSLLIDLRTPTEKYDGFSEDDISFLTVSYDAESESEFSVDRMTVNEGYKVEVDYLNLIHESDNLSLYEFNRMYAYPRVYSPEQIISISDWNELLSLEEAPESFVFKEDMKEGVNYEGDLVAPSIDITKVSPENYHIEVEEVKGPFWMIFSETYHPSWELRGVEKYKHFKVNGLSNGFYIEDLNNENFSIEFVQPSFIELVKPSKIID